MASSGGYGTSPANTLRASSGWLLMSHQCMFDAPSPRLSLWARQQRVNPFVVYIVSASDLHLDHTGLANASPGYSSRRLHSQPLMGSSHYRLAGYSSLV